MDPDPAGGGTAQAEGGAWDLEAAAVRCIMTNALDCSREVGGRDT